MYTYICMYVYICIYIHKMGPWDNLRSGGLGWSRCKMQHPRAKYHTDPHSGPGAYPGQGCTLLYSTLLYYTILGSALARGRHRLQAAGSGDGEFGRKEAAHCKLVCPYLALLVSNKLIYIYIYILIYVFIHVFS